MKLDRFVRFCFPFKNSGFNLLFWELLFAVMVTYLHHPNFVFGDDVIQVKTLCSGLFRPVGIVPTYGRFMPLQGLDVNFILLLPDALRGNIPLLLYAWICLLFLGMSLLFIDILRIAAENVTGSSSVNDWCALLFFLIFLTNPSIIMAFFTNSCMPESRIVFGLAAFMSCAYRFLSTGRRSYGVLMNIAAVYSSCFKENAVILPFIFGFVVLVFGWKQLNRWSRWAFITLLIWPLMYIGTYLIWISPKIAHSYGIGHTVSLTNSVKAIFRNPVMFVVIVVAFVRAFCLVVRRSQTSLFWDALALASAVHAVSYAIMRYSAPYYIAPSCTFAVPVLCYWGSRSLRKWRYSICVPAIVAFSIIIVCLQLPKTTRIITGFISNKEQDVPQLRKLVDSHPTHIYFLRNQQALFAGYALDVFRSFWKYVSRNDAAIVTPCEDIPEMAQDDILVITTFDPKFSHIYNSLKKQTNRNLVRSSMFAWIWGPIDMRPKEVTNGGVVIEANDDSSCRNFHGCESWGRWGKATSTIILGVEKNVRGMPMDCIVKMGAITTKAHPTVPVTIAIGDTIISKMEVGSFPPRPYQFTIPGDCTDVETLEIHFVVSEPVIPSLISNSTDNRELGIAFSELRVTPIVDK